MKNNSFTQKVLATVLQLGEANTRQVLAVISKDIPAARAAIVGRTRAALKIKGGRLRRNPKALKDTAFLVDLGKYDIVHNALLFLVSRKRLRRIRKGIYGPPLPKLYKAS